MLPIDGRRRVSIDAAQAGVDVERHRLERRRFELRLKLRQEYAAWAVGEDQVLLLDEHCGRLEALARWMQSRADAGEESLLAAERMTIAFRSSLVALAEARAVAAAWRERAGAWLLDSGRHLSALQPRLPELLEAPADLDTEARPDVRAARAEIEQAESLEQLSRRVLEAPELRFGWKKIDNGVDEGASDFEGPVFGVGWKIPLFNRLRADRLAAESAITAAVASEVWIARRARSDLASARVAYEELRKAAASAREDFEGLDKIARAATASFEAGETTLTDLLDTLDALLNARLSGLDLYSAALNAHRQLELASGRALTSGDLS
jgi:outer membrane protein TolC